MSLPAPKRILVVEDEMMIAMMLEDMLTEMGHAVVGVAPNLKTALALAAAEQCDLAILDINLAGERSFPVARLLRERGLPFLFATGYGTTGLEDPFRDALTLKKPFQIEDLAQAIETVLTAAEAYSLSRP
jgi:DNA-binding response OmpR family regulator